MRTHSQKKLTLSKSSSLFGMLLGIMFNGLLPEKAAALTANDVLNKMSSAEQTAYISGVVEGLAQARWIKDKPDQSGMTCIYNWYYKGEKDVDRRLNVWFEKHPDKPANALLYVLIKKECGE